jgi:hypothetical protein
MITIREWFQRRKDRKSIKESFQRVNFFIHDCNSSAIEELIKVYHEVLDDYRTKYGTDDIYYHYIGRLEYYKYVKRYKERDELLRRKIEE